MPNSNARTVPHYIGYAGPSIWTSVGNHFGPRLAEWFLSVSMFIQGVVMLANPTIFNQSQLVYFRAVFGTQTLLGVILLTCGVLGLIGLMVNGYRKEVTPWVRTARACVGFMIFTGMSTCFAMSGQYTLWLAWFPVAAVAELVNMFATSKDAGLAYVPRQR
jgi:hypothetical protein